MSSYESTDIPKRELTFQYQPLGDLVDESDPETDADTPSVAGGTEVKLFAENIKEIFQKEATTIPIQKGQDSHFEGDKTQILDTMKVKHKFEITAWVYSNDEGKHSLDSSILVNNGDEAQISNDQIKVEEFDQFIPLGDTQIKYDSETVTRISDGTVLTPEHADSTDGNGDYEMNYSRGEIKFKNGGPTSISTTTEETKILGQTINTTTVISDEFKISYTFEASAQNIARLIRRMSQLGNPFVMRLDKNDYSAPSGEEDAHDFLVIPKKVTVVSQASKPDEYKLELELRKGTIDI